MHVSPRPFQATSGPQSGTLIQQPEAVAFDRWLAQGLSRLYDPVLHEPVPDALQAVLDQIGK